MQRAIAHLPECGFYSPYGGKAEYFEDDRLLYFYGSLFVYGGKIMDPIWNEMYSAAKAVKNARKISDYVTCGEVAAAVLSGSGRIYTGVCIDTCSTLGICAERNAIFNMITNGEQEIAKVLALLPDGSCGAPCGACRELMVQLMPGKYKDIEIMTDFNTGRIVTLGELTPEWWIK